MQETQLIKKYTGPKLFVGRLSPTTTPQSLRSHFEAICPVQVVKVEYSRKSKNNKGFGYVILDRPEDVDGILDQAHVIDDKMVDVMPYSLKATTKWYSNKANSIKVRLTQVPEEVTEQQISLFFEHFARVLVVNALVEKPKNSGYPEKVACVELLNQNRPLLVGRKIVSCDPNRTQDVSYFSIEKLLRDLSKPKSATFIESLNAKSELDSGKNTRYILNFHRENQKDSLSRYELIKTHRPSQDTSNSNYRFNIRAPEGSMPSSQFLARRVGRLGTPTGTSLAHLQPKHCYPVY